MGKLLIYILLLIAALDARAQFASEREIDSLCGIYYSLPDSDTLRLRVCHDIAAGHYNVDSSLVWSQRLLDLATLHDAPWYQARAYGFFSWYYSSVSDYIQSMRYSKQALAIAEPNGFRDIMASNYYRIGNAFYYLSSYESSDEYYGKALDVYRQMGDSSWCAVCYRKIGENNLFQKMYDESKSLYRRAFLIDSAAGDDCAVFLDYIGMGKVGVRRYRDNYSVSDSMLVRNSLVYLLRANAIDCHDPSSRYNLLRHVCDAMYFDIRHFPRSAAARKATLDSLETFCGELSHYSDMLGVSRFNCRASLSRVNLMILRGQYDEAGRCLDSIGSIIHDTKYDYVRDVYYWVCTNYYEAVGDYKRAMHYNSLFCEYLVNEVTVDYAVSNTRKMAEQEFTEQTTEIEERNYRRILLDVCIIVVLAGLALFAFISYRRFKRFSQILNEKNSVITKIHQNLTDSISYASLIQQAAFPKDSLLKTLFNDYFVLYRPLQKVAGDFYWAKRISGYSVVVCADCTGHGVPGAFVSMLGISLLNELCSSIIVNGGNAADVLNVLRTRLMKALGQSKRLHDQGVMVNRDGIDLALVMVDYDRMIMHYAGAYRPLWIWRNGEFIKYKADRMPIGLYLGDYTGFTDHEIEICLNDILYMFSDGIPDQFGYTDDKHTKFSQFGNKRMLQLLTELATEPMQVQKERVEEAVDKWRNGHAQTDDNILIGVRV